MGLCCVDSRKVQKGAIEVLFEILGSVRGCEGFFWGSIMVLCGFYTDSRRVV